MVGLRQLQKTTTPKEESQLTSILTVLRTLLATSILFFALSGKLTAQDQTVGLFEYNKDLAQPGYTLYTPNNSTVTYLIDMYGRAVHSWESDYTPANSVYLLEDGRLLRPASISAGPPTGGGLIEMFDWDGTLLWQFQYANDSVAQHHDIEPLPNGNVLILAREFISIEEAIAAGRDTALLTGDDLRPEHIVEVQPTGLYTGDIVWEWHLWDHLIQDYDSTKPNYGIVTDHPELINLNYAADGQANWIHANAVDYNPDLDQIAISSRKFSEFWVIDHSTTSEEAAGRTGGLRGMGGDLLYRWGNPAAYDRGEPKDQMLFGQHDIQWIKPGLPGEGNFLVFNNGVSIGYSSVDEIIPPVYDGNYIQPPPGIPHSPGMPTWRYIADPPGDFFAFFISGAQRLENGNTLICNGPIGEFFEVTRDSQVVWRYVNPTIATGPIGQGGLATGNLVFRCTRLSADYPAFDGKDLTPGASIEIYPITIASAMHEPEMPNRFEQPVVTAYVSSDVELQSVELFYDAGSGFETLQMLDDGFHGDGTASDDVYGASIPAYPESTTVEYYLSATDIDDTTITDPYVAPAVTYDYTVGGSSLLCGDADGNGDVDIDDVTYVVAYIFGSGPAPDPVNVGDANCSGDVDIDDVVYLINYIFGGGDSPCDPDGDGMQDC
jgi:hypothetical protein